MPRPTSPDLRKDWKVSLPATLAGAVEYQLLDPVTGKPRYAERSRLIAGLLNDWLAKMTGSPALDLGELAPSKDLLPKGDSNV